MLQQLGFEAPYAAGRHPQMKRGHLTAIMPIEHQAETSPACFSSC
jgi:hypothetical protein